jgi:uncharacterized protein YkwD
MRRQIILISICIPSFFGNVRMQESLYQYNPDNFRDVTRFNERVDPMHPDSERLNAVIFYLTNEIRQGNNLPVLKHNRVLEKCASLHSGNMVKYSFFDHTDRKHKNLRNPNDRARFVGINNPYLAENIMETFVLEYKSGEEVYTGGSGIFRKSPGTEPIQPYTYLRLGESLLEGWMNSPVHKSNILSSQAMELGCGTAFFFNKEFNDMPTVIATQNFQLYEPVRLIN